MTHRPAITALICSLCWTTVLHAADSPYAQTVKSLQPTYYYQLNETDTSLGVVDSMGRGPTGTYNGDYVNGPPEVGALGPDFLIDRGAWTFTSEWDDVGDTIDLVGLGDDNVAHASNNAGHITLGDGALFAANAITVSLFALGGPADGGDRLFTNNQTDPLTSFQIVVGNDGIVVSTNPSLECPDYDNCGHRSLFFPGEGIEFTNSGADRGLNSADNGWWHIVASTSGETAMERTENIRLWLNGVDRTEDMLPGTTGWGTDTGLAKIGGRRADPLDSTTHSGAQDEVAIWLDRVLTDEEALLLYNVAIGEALPPTKPGDYNNNGQLDTGDLDLQASDGIANQNLVYDLNGDDKVDFEGDRIMWLHELAKVPVGDADLNGSFTSDDFVTVFIGGLYETGSSATWSQGDWNGDLVFDSNDFVAAFIDGYYEQQNPLGGGAVSAVPEPASWSLAVLAFLICLSRRRGR
jgi:hypothetical protein